MNIASNILTNQIAKKFISFSIVLALVACSLSTDQLADKVKESMKQDFDSKGIKINSLILSKKAGNEYTGILKTTEPNGEFTYEVIVNYDGNNMTWKVAE